MVGVQKSRTKVVGGPLDVWKMIFKWTKRSAYHQDASTLKIIDYLDDKKFKKT